MDNKKPMKGWLSNTTNWMKKQYFNGTHLIDQITNDDNSEKVWLFGIQFQNNKEARIVYGSILWFTYRQSLQFMGFPTITSDVGWGCMIRVGQMMLAQALRLHEGPSLYQDQKFIAKVMSNFIEKTGEFSIQKLTMIGYKKLQKPPGQWYTPGDIAFVIREQCETLNIGFRVLVLDSEFQLTSCVKKLADGSTTNISPALLIILTRIGYMKPEQKYLNSVISLLKDEDSCIGILGGRPGKAHYLVGTTEESFIYLDPHCVKAQKNLDSFFSEKLFSLNHQKIDPSMGICFYVKNLTQLVLLNEKLKQMNKILPIYSHSVEAMDIIEETQEFIVL